MQSEILNYNLVCYLNRCETWSLTFMEEHTLMTFKTWFFGKVFEPMRQNVTADWREVHNEEPVFCDICQKYNLGK